MLKFGDNEYRNLQEQVLKNKDDIEQLRSSGNIAELGIKIINAENPYTSIAQLPDAATYTGNYGDGYIVGAGSPYELYIYSRSSDPNVKGFWFDWGQLNAPSIVPGPIGPQGPQGQQGVRGSFWYTQSGAPTNTTGVNANDQALDGSTGNTYQFVNGQWQLTGNIRGPQGIQGIQGITGPAGATGPEGPQGPKGDQGQFIQIVGELQNENQLPMIDSTPRYAAYLIPGTDGTQHVWLIIGEGTTENPYLWHDAGGFGSGGSKIMIGGTEQAEVELGKVFNGAPTRIAPSQQTTSSLTGGVQFENILVQAKNISDAQISGLMTLQLPFYKSTNIEPKKVGQQQIQFDLTQTAWDAIQEMVDEAKPEEVQITAPITSTNGRLSTAQLATLQANKGAYLMFNNEIYRLQDTQHESGYLVYSHIGYEDSTATYKVKCITVTISTRNWVLTERELIDASQGTVVQITSDSYICTFHVNKNINSIDELIDIYGGKSFVASGIHISAGANSGNNIIRIYVYPTGNYIGIGRALASSTIVSVTQVSLKTLTFTFYEDNP